MYVFSPCSTCSATVHWEAVNGKASSPWKRPLVVSNDTGFGTPAIGVAGVSSSLYVSSGQISLGNAKHLYDRGKTAIFDEIVRRCCEIKAHVVSCDEKESGLRAILNYGHTFAHPVETLSSYRISHGEAVSIGMECAGLLALELGMWSKEQYLRQAALLDALHLPRRLPENTDIDSVIELMKSDKKNRNGKITFVLPVSTGSVKVVSDIPVELIRKVISEN